MNVPRSSCNASKAGRRSRARGTGALLRGTAERHLSCGNDGKKTGQCRCVSLSGVILSLKYLRARVVGQLCTKRGIVECKPSPAAAAVKAGSLQHVQRLRGVRPSPRAAALSERLLAPQRFASAAAATRSTSPTTSTCRPSIRRSGPPSVNPTIQAIYRSIFDQYIGQKPDLAFEPGLLTEWGWNDDKTKVWMDVRDGVTWHDGSPFTAGGRRLVARARRQAGRRQPDPVRLGRHRQLQDRRQQHHRRRDAIRPGAVQVDGVPHRLHAAEGLLREGRPEGFEKKPIGTGPYMVDEFERNAFLRLKANPKYWGGKPAFETVIFKFVPDATSRVAEIESGSSRRDARNPLRGIRPAEGQAGPDGRRARRSPTSA